jgi:hypothetical protein
MSKTPLSANERNKQWSRYILDKLEGKDPPRPDEDPSVCHPGAHGTCLTHGQVLEECARNNKEL